MRTLKWFMSPARLGVGDSLHLKNNLRCLSILIFATILLTVFAEQEPGKLIRSPHSKRKAGDSVARADANVKEDMASSISASKVQTLSALSESSRLLRRPSHSSNAASASSNDMSISASSFQDLQQGKMMVDQGLEALDSLSAALATGRVGDDELLSSVITDRELQDLREASNQDSSFSYLQEAVTQMQSIAVTVESMVDHLYMVPEFAEQMKSASKHLDSLAEDEDREEEINFLADDLPPKTPNRHLQSLFSGKSDSDNSKNSNEGNVNDSSYKENRFKSTAEWERYLRRFSSGTSSTFSHFSSISLGFSGARHHHRSIHRIKGRRLTEGVAEDSCDTGCDDIDDNNERKQCNCNDLVRCIRELKVNDYAIIFSSGLVDGDTGVILENSPEYTTGLDDGDTGEIGNSNTGSEDIFDADHLLAKIGNIRNLTDEWELLSQVEEANDLCSEILGSFHVPCKDWRENGCPEANGRSYQMTVDEICDSVNSPDLILFKNMSSLFDPETSIEDSCGNKLPDENIMLEKALSTTSDLVKNLFLESISDDPYYLEQFNIGPCVYNAKFSFSFNKESIFTESFVKKCLEGQRECCESFPGMDMRATMTKNVSPDTTCSKRFRVGDGQKQTNKKVDIALSCKENVIIGTVKNETNITVGGGGGPWGGDSGHTVTLEKRNVTILGLDTQRIQNVLLESFEESVNASIPSFKDCIYIGCDVDNRVGLQSCQEMIDCVEKIYDAGEEMRVLDPLFHNPYPFYNETDISKVRDASWDPFFEKDKIVRLVREKFDAFELNERKSFICDEQSSLAHFTVKLGITLNPKDDGFARGCAERTCCPLTGQRVRATITQQIELGLNQCNHVNATEFQVISGHDDKQEVDVALVCSGTNITGRVVEDTTWDYELVAGLNGSHIESTISGDRFMIRWPLSLVLTYNNKWDLINWPERWNTPPNKHGLIELADPQNNALVFRDKNALEMIESTFKTSYGYTKVIQFEGPASCSLDVQKDDRCDTARLILFGEDASVGQICEIAETKEMPGSCCLDNVQTSDNFGEMYQCGQKCTKPAPRYLGFSEQACDLVHGVWCRAPCNTLKECIEDKPKRGYCRAAASYSIDGEFNLTHSGQDCELPEDIVSITVTCKDENGMACRLPTPKLTSAPSSMPSSDPSSTPSQAPSVSGQPSLAPSGLPSTMPSSSASKSDEFGGLDNFGDKDISSGDASFGNAFEDRDVTDLDETSSDAVKAAHFCEDRNLTFSYTIRYESRDLEPNSVKKITKFIKGQNGFQRDLFSSLGNETDLEVGNDIVLEVTETVKLCSYGSKTHKALIALDLHNSLFNEAFDEYTSDLIITDSSDEEQCSQVREFMGFDRDYNIDSEICREFNVIQCDFNSGSPDIVRAIQENQKGGPIPAFKGFDFQGSEFSGSEFTKSEFVGFGFEGFEQAPDLSFQEIGKAEFLPREDPLDEGSAVKTRKEVLKLEKTYMMAEFVKKKIDAVKCTIPECFPFIGCTDLPCKIFNGIKAFALLAAHAVLVGSYLAYAGLNVVYSEKFDTTAEENKEVLHLARAVYENMEITSSLIYENQDIINRNMQNQHTEVRATLASQHEEMTSILTDQHSKIGLQLTEQHNSIGEQLTTQHTLVGDQLTKQHNSMGEQLTNHHTSLGVQLTEAHVILRDNILALASALGGNIDSSKILSWPGDQTPLHILNNMIDTSGEHIEGEVKSLKRNVMRTRKSLQNEIGSIRQALEKEAVSAQVSQNEVVTRIDVLENEVVSVRESLEALEKQVVSVHEALVTIESKIDSSERRLDNIVVSYDRPSLELEVSVSCPPQAKKKEHHKEIVTVNLLVDTQANTDVTRIAAVYADKGGDLKSQVGNIVKTRHLDPGLQLVSVELRTEPGAIETENDVAMLRVIVKGNGEGTPVQQKSIVFDYSACWGSNA